MTFRASLHDYLREAVDVSVFDARLSTRPQLPALVVRFISAGSVLTHSAPSSLLPRRVQIDCYSWNDAEADDLATRVLLALDGYHGPMLDATVGWCRLANDLELTPLEPGGDGKVRFQRILDFELSYQEARSTPVPVTS